MTITIWPADAVTGAPIYSGRKLRQTGAVSLAGATAARPLGARSGVRPGTSTTMVTATATTWTVGPHAGVLDLELAAESGPYCYSSDANVTGTVTAASVVRTDLVWARLDDPAEGDGSSVPGVVFGYTTGTSVTPPATPARAMVLAWINVPASGGGAPTVTPKAPYLAVGITPGTTAAAFGAGAFVGQYIDDPALGLLRWDGTGWRAIASTNDTSWIAPPMDSPWENFGGAYAPVQYVREHNWVEFDGNARPVSTVGESRLFTLPAGFRPSPGYRRFLISVGNVAGLLEVRTDGSVVLGSGAAAGSIVSLSGVHFKAGA